MSILKPKIVFDINEEWNVSRLSDIGIKVKEKNKNYEYDQVLTNSASQGVVLQSDYFEKSIANTNNINGYYVVRVNDFVYNPRISNDAPVGPISRNTITDGVMSPLYTVFRVKNINLEFLDQYFKSNHWHRYMKSVANYGARHDRMAISSNDFINLPIKHPSLPEQQKIADFLTAVDKRIELLEKKKTLLETYKKGVMKKIFNQEIRFKDDNGNDFPDWEEYVLNDLGDTLNGLTGKTKDDFDKGSSKYIQYKQVFGDSKIDPNGFGLVDVGETEKQTEIKYGDILFTTSSETPNEIGMSSVFMSEIQNVYLNSFCFGFRPKSLENLIPNFSRFLFRSEKVRSSIVKLAQGSTRFNMSKTNFLKIRVRIPSVEEQVKISEFLSSIDIQIELLESQIHKSKTWKKGLLQKMFV